MTSLRGPGERNFNAVSHKPTRASIQSVQSVPVSFGLWDTALKFLSPGPRNDVTDHLAVIRGVFKEPLARATGALKTLIVPRIKLVATQDVFKEKAVSRTIAISTPTVYAVKRAVTTGVKIPRAAEENLVPATVTAKV